jgi:hypothetical protein
MFDTATASDALDALRLLARSGDNAGRGNPLRPMEPGDLWGASRTQSQLPRWGPGGEPLARRPRPPTGGLLAICTGLGLRPSQGLGTAVALTGVAFERDTGPIRQAQGNHFAGIVAPHSLGHLRDIPVRKVKRDGDRSEGGKRGSISGLRPVGFLEAVVLDGCGHGPCSWRRPVQHSFVERVPWSRVGEAFQERQERDRVDEANLSSADESLSKRPVRDTSADQPLGPFPHVLAGVHCLDPRCPHLSDQRRQIPVNVSVEFSMAQAHSRMDSHSCSVADAS